MKDPVTGMMTLEAGALMLADQGIVILYYDEFKNHCNVKFVYDS